MKIYIMEKILTYGKVVMKVQVGKKEKKFYSSEILND